MNKFSKIILSICPLLMLGACIEDADDKDSSECTTAECTNAHEGSNCGDNIRAAMLSQVNTFRQQAQRCGVKYMPAAQPLEWDYSLADAAKTHSKDMATHNFFSHTGSDGSSVGQRVTATGAPYSYVGENIYAGSKSVERAIQSWIKSPGHCENIMNKYYKKLGAACIKNSNSEYTYYWTQVFTRD